MFQQKEKEMELIKLKRLRASQVVALKAKRLATAIKDNNTIQGQQQEQQQQQHMEQDPLAQEQEVLKNLSLGSSQYVALGPVGGSHLLIYFKRFNFCPTVNNHLFLYLQIMV